MKYPKTLLLIDGQNLKSSYDQMIKKGNKPIEGVVVSKNFVWHPEITQFAEMDIVHAYYFSLVHGDDVKVENIRNEISNISFRYGNYNSVTKKFDCAATLTPRIFRKQSGTHINKNQDDISIVIEALRHSYQKTVDVVYIVSGDGDYIPVIEEIMRNGVRVIVGAFSRGLSPELKNTADEFIDFDILFFGAENY